MTEDLAEICGDSSLDFSILRGKTFLISGANGFLPAYMAETLLFLNETKNFGVKVIGLVRNRAKAEKRFAYYLGREDFRLDTQNLYERLEHTGSIDYVVHAASQASPKYYGVDPAGTLAPNIVGTYHLLELAREKSAQGFFYFSSSEVYGQPTGEASLHEKSFGPLDCLQVRACYAESKRMGETMCLAWHQQYGIPTFIVRPFHTYGPGLQANDGRVFADFVFNVLKSENIVMHSDGSARRAFCYASDAIAGFFSVLLKGTPAQAYNVANPGGELSVMELAELLVGLYPAKHLAVDRRHAPDSPGYIPSAYSRLVPDVARLSALGWTAQIDPPAGFRRMIEAYTA